MWFICWWDNRAVYDGPKYWLEYPKLNSVQVEKELDAISEESQANADNPAWYFENLSRFSRLELAISRAEKEAVSFDEELIRMRVLISRAGSIQQGIRHNFVTRHGEGTMAETSRLYQEKTGLKGLPLVYNHEMDLVWKNILLIYLWMIPFAFLGFLLMIEQDGQSPILELFAFWRPLLAACCPPVAVLVYYYPNGNRREQAAQAVRSTLFVLSGVLSIFCGGISKAADKKQSKSTTWTGQVDIRHKTGLAGGTPPANEFLRVSAYGSNGFLADSVTVASGNNWLQNVTVGQQVFMRGGLSIYPAAGITLTSSGNTSTNFGAQVYFTRGPTNQLPQLSIASPVVSFERNLTTGESSFAWMSQTTLTFQKQLLFGVETGGSKRFGATTGGYIGPFVGLLVSKDKKTRLEAGLYREFSGTNSLRLRILHNFAFANGM